MPSDQTSYNKKDNECCNILLHLNTPRKLRDGDQISTFTHSLPHQRKPTENVFCPFSNECGLSAAVLLAKSFIYHFIMGFFLTLLDQPLKSNFPLAKCSSPSFRGTGESGSDYLEEVPFYLPANMLWHEYDSLINPDGYQELKLQQLIKSFYSDTLRLGDVTQKIGDNEALVTGEPQNKIIGEVVMK